MVSAARMTRWLGIAILLIGYPVLAHYTNVNVQNGTLGAVVAVGPALVIGLIYALKSSPRWFWLSLFILAGAAGGASWTVLEHHFGVVYWIQDAGMQCVLFMTFSRTLVAGRKPLCTHFAEMMHGEITPQHAHYARQVTWAWAIFFALMAIFSTILFFLAPLTAWSVFANFLTLPLIALMFMLEYLVRRILLPERNKSRIFDIVKIWNNQRNPIHSKRQEECKT